jgi:hypothetical protein
MYSMADPPIADQTLRHVELAFRENLSLVDLRPPDNELEPAGVSRRLADDGEARLELIREEKHACEMSAHPMESIILASRRHDVARRMAVRAGPDTRARQSRARGESVYKIGG